MSEVEHGGVRGAIDVPNLLVIGGSAGGLPALRTLLSDLPRPLDVPVVVALHLPPSAEHPSQLAAVLARWTPMPVRWAAAGERPEAGNIYVAPQDGHTLVDADGRLAIVPAPQRPRPSVDRLFASAAAAFGAGAVGVVLSGYLSDGAVGAMHILQAGGSVLVQDRTSSEQYEMPSSVLNHGGHALVLPARVLAAALTTILSVPGGDAWFRLQPRSPYMATVAAAV